MARILYTRQLNLLECNWRMKGKKLINPHNPSPSWMARIPYTRRLNLLECIWSWGKKVLTFILSCQFNASSNIKCPREKRITSAHEREKTIGQLNLLYSSISSSEVRVSIICHRTMTNNWHRNYSRNITTLGSITNTVRDLPLQYFVQRQSTSVNFSLARSCVTLACF
jgi:hypothetical protein